MKIRKDLRGLLLDTKQHEGCFSCFVFGPSFPNVFPQNTKQGGRGYGIPIMYLTL